MMISRRFALLLAGMLSLHLCAGAVGAAGAAVGQAEPVEIDAVWSEARDGRHEIFHTMRRGGQWSDPEMVTDDYFDNQQPAIDRDSQGRVWLVWTAYSSQRKELRYTVGDGEVWQESKTIEVETTTNNAPSLAVDGDNVAWLVWAGNNGGDDDIYYAHSTDGQWSEPALVHGPNDRMDVLPELAIAPDGRPVVSWQAMVDGDYVTLSSSYGDGAWSQEVPVAEGDEDEADDGANEEIALPSFIDDNKALFLRLYHSF